MIAMSLLCGASMAHAGEQITADTNLAIGANTILAKFERVTEVPASEIPNVDKSLAIGARSILGIFPRVTQVNTTEKPSVDKSRDAFVDGVLNRTSSYEPRGQ